MLLNFWMNYSSLLPHGWVNWCIFYRWLSCDCFVEFISPASRSYIIGIRLSDRLRSYGTTSKGFRIVSQTHKHIHIHRVEGKIGLIYVALRMGIHSKVPFRCGLERFSGHNSNVIKAGLTLPVKDLCTAFHLRIDWRFGWSIRHDRRKWNENANVCHNCRMKRR